MFRLELTNRAERDLRELSTFLSAQGSANGLSRFRTLGTTILSLQSFPLRGHAVPEDAAYRQVLHGRKPNVFRIIYHVDEARRLVTVVHLRHAARKAGLE